jgi:hypothetical protein
VLALLMKLAMPKMLLLLMPRVRPPSWAPTENRRQINYSCLYLKLIKFLLIFMCDILL